MGDAAKFLSALTDLNEKIEGVSLTQGTDTRAHREARTYYEKQRHALFVEKAASLGFLQLDEKALEEQGQVVVTRTYSGREAKRKANELRKNVNAYAKTLATDLEPFGGKDAAKELQRTAIQIAKAAFGNIDPWERHDKVKKRVQKTMLYGTTLVTLLGAAVGYRLLRGANVAPGTGTSQVDKTPTKREPTPSTTPTTVVEQSPNLNQAEVNWLNGTTKVNDNERFVMANGQPGGEMQRCTIVGSEVPPGGGYIQMYLVGWQIEKNKVTGVKDVVIVGGFEDAQGGRFTVAFHSAGTDNLIFGVFSNENNDAFHFGPDPAYPKGLTTTANLPQELQKDTGHIIETIVTTTAFDATAPKAYQDASKAQEQTATDLLNFLLATKTTALHQGKSWKDVLVPDLLKPYFNVVPTYADQHMPLMFEIDKHRQPTNANALVVPGQTGGQQENGNTNQQNALVAGGKVGQPSYADSLLASGDVFGNRRQGIHL